MMQKTVTAPSKKLKTKCRRSSGVERIKMWKKNHAFFLSLNFFRQFMLITTQYSRVSNHQMKQKKVTASSKKLKTEFRRSSRTHQNMEKNHAFLSLNFFEIFC